MKFFRKIVIGVSTIVFTTVALTSTTYAWFKINSRASITGLNFKLTGGQGFYVSIDGVKFSNDLTNDQIIKAMIAKLDPQNYAIHYDEITGESDLYKIYTEVVRDENGNVVTYNDGNGNQVPKTTINYDQVASLEEFTRSKQKLELMPVTSKNGVTMQDLHGGTATANSGRFVEFDVYFKTASQTGFRRATSYDAQEAYWEYDEATKTYIPTTQSVTNENYFNFYVDKGQNSLNYNIYLNGDTTWKDPITGEETQVSPTSFKTVKAEDVAVSANMTAVVNNLVVNLTKENDDHVTVYGANALRMSITDNKAYTDSGGKSGCLIYELNDYDHYSDNLGSYATQYSESYCNEHGLTYSTDQEKMYGYRYNASYTYYSNLKGAVDLEHSNLYGKMYSYIDDGIPTHTIKYDDLKRDVNDNYVNNKVITTLSSDDLDPTLLTFRIWLEGWDADCFDGIAGNIKTLLSFVAVPL